MMTTAGQHYVPREAPYSASRRIGTQPDHAIHEGESRGTEAIRSAMGDRDYRLHTERKLRLIFRWFFNGLAEYGHATPVVSRFDPSGIATKSER